MSEEINKTSSVVVIAALLHEVQAGTVKVTHMTVDTQNSKILIEATLVQPLTAKQVLAIQSLLVTS